MNNNFDFVSTYSFKLIYVFNLTSIYQAKSP